MACNCRNWGQRGRVAENRRVEYGGCYGMLWKLTFFFFFYPFFLILYFFSFKFLLNFFSFLFSDDEEARDIAVT